MSFVVQEKKTLVPDCLGEDRLL